MAIGAGLAAGAVGLLYYLTRPKTATTVTVTTSPGTTQGTPSQLGAAGQWVCHKAGDFTVCVQQNGASNGNVQGAPAGPSGTVGAGTLGWCYRDSGGAIVCIEPIEPPKRLEQ